MLKDKIKLLKMQMNKNEVNQDYYTGYMSALSTVEGIIAEMENKKMTGSKAWDLIRPFIDPMTHEECNNADMAEAFCVVYIALKEYDMRWNNEKENS